jgi:hypothetical protein
MGSRASKESKGLTRQVLDVGLEVLLVKSLLDDVENLHVLLGRRVERGRDRQEREVILGKERGVDAGLGIEAGRLDEDLGTPAEA